MGFSDKWRRNWQLPPVRLPGKSHGWRSLVGCCLWGCEESDTTERLHFHFSLSCIGEGNGNPLQDSCLENPRDGGAWWAVAYGVAQSRTLPKRLSSSSNSDKEKFKRCLHKVQDHWETPKSIGDYNAGLQKNKTVEAQGAMRACLMDAQQRLWNQKDFRVKKISKLKLRVWDNVTRVNRRQLKWGCS